jgi:enoyl-CoA hydratase/carnithine racemase
VADDELLPTAHALAREIADNTSAVAVGAARQLLWSMLGAPSPGDAHRAESAALAALGAGEGAAEGVRSFLEKRPADFRAPVTEVPGVPVWPGRPDDLRQD